MNFPIVQPGEFIFQQFNYPLQLLTLQPDNMSSTTTLSIVFNNPQDLQSLSNSGQQICIVRTFNDTNKYIVVSAVFSPFGQKNDVLFYDSWQLYAMPGDITQLNTVKMQMTQNVLTGQQYTFSGAAFTAPVNTGISGSFGFNNNAAMPLLCGGLAQQMNINNTDGWYALNAVQLLANEVSYFTPGNNILVFIAGGIDCGTILPASILASANNPNLRIPSSIGKYLQVDITANTTIHFDGSSNSFVQG
jgi:hypothetical protein